MLLAPGLFSMMIGWPSLSSSPLATSRVTESVIPPGVYGTIHLMGLFGYAGCPHAEPASASAAAAATMICRIDMVSSLPGDEDSTFYRHRSGLIPRPTL